MNRTRLLVPGLNPRRVPQGRVLVDWTHPLARNLVSCYVPASFARFGDLTGNGVPLVPGTAAAIGISNNGGGLRSTVAQTGANLTPGTAQKPANITLFWQGQCVGNGSSSSGEHLWGITANNTNSVPYESFTINPTTSTTTAIHMVSGIGGAYLDAGTIVTPTVGQTVTIAATYNQASGAQTAYANGVSTLTHASTAGTAIPYSSTSTLSMGSYGTYDTTRYSNAITEIALLFNRDLTADEILWLNSEPLAFLIPDTLTAVYASAGVPVVLTPGAGVVGAAGLGPSLVIGEVMAPGAGAESVTGLAPTVAAGAAFAPAAGAESVTGLGPSVVAGFAPTPGAGAVSVAGGAPTVVSGAVLAPGAGVESVSGLTPTVVAGTGVTLTPGAGTATVTGGAPTIAGGAEPQPGAGVVSVAGLAPTIVTGDVLTPGAGVVSVAGLAPTAAAGAAFAPGAGAVAVAGLTPTVVSGAVLAPGAGTATVSGLLPTIVAGVTLGPIPTGWPSIFTFGVGTTLGGTDSAQFTYLAASGQPPYGMVYRYLSGGINSGWQTYGSSFVPNYISAAHTGGFVPCFIYYMIVGSPPQPNDGSPQTDLNTNSTMLAYFADFKALMLKIAGATSSPVYVDVEPDMWGYLEPAGLSQSVSVAASGDTDLSGLPNTAAGLQQAYVHIRNLYAPNVVIGANVSVWAWSTSTNPNLNVAAIAATDAAFMTGASWDCYFSDIAYGDSGYTGVTWDKTNTTGPNFNMLNNWATAFCADTQKRLILWQTPAGNTVYRTCNNTAHHYQDTKVEYWLQNYPSDGHLSALANTGVIGVMFPGGEANSTSIFDAAGDGITNPTAINGNNTVSTVADDDGGGVRTWAGAYYTAPLTLPSQPSAVLTPGAGVVSVAGLTPTVAAGAVFHPGTGLIAAAGLAVGLAAGAAFGPGVGAATAAGLSPAIIAGWEGKPSPGLLSTLGLLPTLDLGGAEPVTLTPGPGTASAAGGAPRLVAGFFGLPSPGALEVSGLQPSLERSFVGTPGAAEATVSGLVAMLTTERPVYMPGSSGTYDWNPSLSDVLLEAFERCGIRPNSLTTEHVQSCRRSMNYVQSRWSNLGVNLWRVVELTAYMPRGVWQYAVDPAVVDVLPDVFIRQYQVGAPLNVAPAFSTAAGSDVVTVTTSGPLPQAGQYMLVGVPVSVGGVVLSGFYQVQSTVGLNGFTILASIPAVSTVSGAGAVPSYTTTQASTSVLVTLPAHGFLAGQQYMVGVLVQVGGITLQGSYVIQTVQDANNFTIVSPYPAGSAGTQQQNGGLTQIAVQTSALGLTQGADPVDILMYPLSRNDYAAIPDKRQEGRPTSFWYDRTLEPTINVWPVPNETGPYELHYYVHRQLQDANVTGGQVGDMPQRFYEAYVAGIAAHLSMKWAPDRSVELAAYSERCWAEASDEDREKVPMRISPDFSGYYH